MSNLPERLRKLHAMTLFEVALEAADALETKDDEIEWLRAENKKLREENERLKPNDPDSGWRWS
jgi:cell division protein FtsB